jgi:hypothetical protein
MTDDEIRESARQRLSTGQVPRELHMIAQPMTPGQPVPTGMVVGSALPDPCAVCDERSTQLRYNRPDGSIAFHQRCHEIWKEEARRPIRRAD